MFSYGCWCQLRNNDAGGILDGQGLPVDQLDAACKVTGVNPRTINDLSLNLTVVGQSVSEQKNCRDFVKT